MNNKQTKLITESCQLIKEEKIQIKRRAWFETNDKGHIISCDPIFAVILVHGENFMKDILVNGIPKDLDLSNPGFLEKACEILDVNAFWLRRFSFGFDYGHQVLFISGDERDKKFVKDEVSEFGIQLLRDLKC